MMLSFGKYRGKTLEEVPPDYLIWLCCWRVEYDHDVERVVTTQGAQNDAQKWLQGRFPGVVQAARVKVKNERLCHICGKPLVPIGNARSNGRPHDDWRRRTLHKRCWRSVMDSDSE